MSAAAELGRRQRNLGLDLVRALAITLVLITHGGNTVCSWYGCKAPVQYLPTGSLGVESFFALSGFLIGGLLLDIIERNLGPGAWWRFMMRRWLRTLPLYYLWLAVLVIVVPPGEGHFSEILAHATLTQNLQWPMPSDWFAVSWSLTVEEWFYLLFSVALLGGSFLTRRPRATLWCIIAVFVVVPTAMRWMVPDSLAYGEYVRKVTLLRLDAIAYGVAVVALCRARSRLVARPLVLLAIGLGMVGGIVLLAYHPPPPQGHWLRTFGPTIMPLGCALCLPAATLIERLPGFAWPVRKMSTYSYALYVSHLTVLDQLFQLRNQWGLSAAVSTALAVLLTFGLSVAVHRWVELPILACRPRQFPRASGAPPWVQPAGI